MKNVKVMRNVNLSSYKFMDNRCVKYQVLFFEKSFSYSICENKLSLIIQRTMLPQNSSEFHLFTGSKRFKKFTRSSF